MQGTSHRPLARRSSLQEDWPLVELEYTPHTPYPGFSPPKPSSSPSDRLAAWLIESGSSCGQMQTRYMTVHRYLYGGRSSVRLFRHRSTLHETRLFLSVLVHIHTTHPTQCRLSDHCSVYTRMARVTASLSDVSSTACPRSVSQPAQCRSGHYPSMNHIGGC